MIMNLQHIRYAPLLALWKAVEKMDLAYFESVQLPHDVRVLENISYGFDAQYHLMDIAYPKDKQESYPLIIQVHGGGWVYGSKDTIYKAYGMALAQKGFAVITLNYRLAPTHRFPDQLYDIDLLLQFIQQHAKQYALDVEQVFMVGDSAGAHLISLYQCIQRYSLPHPFQFQSKLKVKAVALSCGVYDFDSFNTIKIKFPQKTNTLRSLFGVSDFKSHPMYPWSSPANLINDTFPDALIISSEFDPLYHQTKEWVEKLESKNINVETFIVERKFRLPHVFNTRLSNPKSVEALNEIADFFQKRAIV
jgi:acetyl esterase/lipase